MKKKGWFLLVLFLSFLLLSGCSSQYASQALTAEVEARVVPLALSWVKEHVEGAEAVTADITGPNVYMLYADLAKGTYKRQGVNCSYLLNVDSGEFLTDEAYQTFLAFLRGQVAAALPQELMYTALTVEADGETVTGHTISDQGPGTPKGERRLEEQTQRVGNMLHAASEEELKQKAIYDAENNPISIYVYMNSLEQIEPLFSDLKFLHSHPLWEIRFKQGEGKEYYVLALWEDRYTLLRYYPGKDGKFEYEYVSKSPN